MTLSHLPKNEKRSEDFDTNKKNLQPRYRNEIWQWKMFPADKEKWKKRNNKKNRTVKSGKNPNAWSEEKLQ